MPDLPTRIEERIQRTEDCWEWLGAKNGKGYGHTTWDGTTRKAHRVVYQLLVGPIPDGLTLDHLCRNTSCVNPEHLEPATNRENILRGDSFSAENARKTHCVRGHELTGDNVRLRGRWRICVECQRMHGRAYMRRNPNRWREVRGE